MYNIRYSDTFYFIKIFISNPHIKISGLPRKKCLATPLIHTVFYYSIEELNAFNQFSHIKIF